KSRGGEGASLRSAAAGVLDDSGSGRGGGRDSLPGRPVVAAGGDDPVPGGGKRDRPASSMSPARLPALPDRGAGGPHLVETPRFRAQDGDGSGRCGAAGRGESPGIRPSGRVGGIDPGAEG